MKANVRSSQLITNVRARRPVERWSTGVNLGVLVKHTPYRYQSVEILPLFCDYMLASMYTQ